MSVLKIEQNDILWKYYEKAYTLSNLEIEPPTNFCQYFWYGLGGMLQSFYEEVQLWFVWLVALLLPIACVGLSWLAESVLGSPYHILIVPITSLLFVASLANIAATWLATDGRLTGRWRTMLRWLTSSAVGGIILCAIGILLYHCVLSVAGITSWAAAGERFETLAIVCGILAMMLICGVVVVLAVVALWRFILSPMGSWRFIQAIWMMIKSFKHQVCPLIEPPEAFMASYEIKKCRESS